VHSSFNVVKEFVDSTLGDKLPGPEHRHLISGVLNLIEHMGGQQYGSAVGDSLASELPESPLHKRVHSAGWFIKNDELRFGRECSNQTDLSTVPRGELPHRPVQVGIKALGKEFMLAAKVSAAKRSKITEKRAACEAFG